jgi:REP element-mobilizing transposase RayT
VHLLTTLPRTIAIAEFVKELKRVSTNRIHMQRRDLEEFHWQAGYGIFSVSESVVPVVARYIRNQEAHHRASTYRAEYRTLLRKHGVVWDEAHVWD